MAKLYGYEQLAQLVSEERPVLMLDRVCIDTETKSAEGIKAVSMDEMFFQGHFPDAPIMPGVLQVAGIAQLGKALTRALSGSLASEPLALSAIHRLKFRKPVLPGDRLTFSVAFEDVDPNADTVTFKGAALVEGVKTCEGTLTLSRSLTTDRTPGALAPELRDFPGREDGPALNILEIMQNLPHRYPFLLIDRILVMDMDARRIVALKNVTGNEPFFAGNGEAKTMPSFLQTEIAAQAGCSLALATPGNENKLGYFMSIDHAEFHHPVLPGDQLIVDVSAFGKGRFGRGEGCLYVGDKLVGEICLKFAVIDPEE